MAKKEATCKGEHAGHICVLASSNKFDLIKEITRKPKHVCFNCGRVADSENNLWTRCLWIDQGSLLKFDKSRFRKWSPNAETDSRRP